jgi:hypothetical protein
LKFSPRIPARASASSVMIFPEIEDAAGVITMARR